jgi:Ca-activated chloride channel family protein
MRVPAAPSQRLLLAVALVAAAVAAAAAPGRDAAAPSDEAPLPPVADRFAAWLDEVAPLLSADERAAFAALPRPYQKDAFIRRFWEVRDPFPQTPANELRDAWEERAHLARDRYGTFADPRSELLRFNGEPAKVSRTACSELLRPVEVWIWSRTDKIRGSFAVAVETVPHQDGESGARLWNPRDGLSALAWSGGSESDRKLVTAIQESCPRGDELLADLSLVVDWNEAKQRYGLVPHPNPEWLATFRSYSTDVPADGAPLSGTLEVRFPDRHQSRTVVETVVSIPRDAPLAAEHGPRTSWSFVLDGEVLLGDELFDHFRVRFDLPVDAQAADRAIPLLAERYLRPGRYGLVVRVEDVNGHRFFRDERQIEVPVVEPRAVAVALAPAPAPLATAGVPAPAVATSPAAASPVADDEVSLRLTAPSDELVMGRLRLDADVVGRNVARVDFALDGKAALSKGRPPWSVELDLGHAPRLHTVRAVARDAAGRELAADQLLLNGGPHRFSVRLREPAGISPGAESVTARAEVEVPEGERLDRLELWVNDTRYATLFQAPFVQVLPVPAGGSIAYVRAVAYLEGGGAAEDVRLLHAGPLSEQMDVDLVELYTTMLDRGGRPVENLRQEDVEVRENDTPQTIVRFERVLDVPIHAAILLDTSASMAEELTEAETAALGFFQKVLSERDRGAVITFADAPHLAARFSNRLDMLAGGLSGLTADGETRLWDSVAYSLHYMSGIRGKRALVVLTDGLDSGSKLRFDEALDYARRTGVAIYTVGLSLPAGQADVRMKLAQLAIDTGGRAYQIERAVELTPVYRQIERELRAQYLIAYQSTSTGEAFRSIDLKVKRSGVEARTLRGYYP